MTSQPAPTVPSPYNVANAVTVLRILLVPVFGALLFAEGGDDVGLRTAACAVFVVATLTDKIDGDLARRRGIVTSFGQIAPSVAGDDEDSHARGRGRHARVVSRRAYAAWIAASTVSG